MSEQSVKRILGLKEYEEGHEALEYRHVGSQRGDKSLGGALLNSVSGFSVTQETFY